MGNEMRAETLLEETARRMPVRFEQVAELFRGTPLDFPVAFTDRLPFGAHRFGMVGITLFGKVRFLNRVRDFSPVELLSLLRHEAEHVRQQRRNPVFFYPLYGLWWLAGFFNPWPDERLKRLRGQHGRSLAAYRAIPYEVDAYGVGDATRTLLRGLVRRDFF